MTTRVGVARQTVVHYCQRLLAPPHRRGSGEFAFMVHLPIDQQITFLYTKDLQRTAQFYEKILGLPLALDQGSCRIYQVTASAFVGFCEREETPDSPEGVIFTIVTEAVDLWHQELSKKGVQFEEAPRHNPAYQIYHCFLRDPNGYLIEIQKFLDPAWPSQ